MIEAAIAGLGSFLDMCNGYEFALGLRACAREAMEQRFSIPRMADETARVYERVLGETP